jgi:hypothetical protein
LTAVFIPQATGAAVPNLVVATSPIQHWQSSGDGSTWYRVDWNDANHPLTTTFTTPAGGGAQTWFMGVNADLWTTTIGYNQDIGICLTQGSSVGSCSGAAIVGWKESGGLLAAYAPNAAMLESTVALQPGTQYTVTVVWKANVAYSRGAIYGGAGSGYPYSPTTLLLQLAE